jgi:beta-lactamase superfamily II metal-dependent hydrolase
MPRDDGYLHIMYNEMGQGDNILIKCPNGNVVVIDCGCARWDGNYFEPTRTASELRAQAIGNIFETGFLKDDQIVNALILTHSDQDHCNQLRDIFNHQLTAIPKVTQIDALYHSGNLTQYIAGSAHSYLMSEVTLSNSYAITVNQDGQSLNGAAILDSQPNLTEINKKSMQVPTMGFIKILDGTKNSPPCNVYILASNVKPYPGFEDGYGESTAEQAANRSSVVTMVIYGDKKFLFLGDATYFTEKFLKDTYGDKIKDLEMLHVGHHGSYRTSSSYKNDAHKPQAVRDIDFVSHVNPRYLAVSAAWNCSSPKLPRWETIQNYINGADRLVRNDGAELQCWWKEYTLSTPKTKKSQVAEIWGPKTTDRYVLCTGTEGVLDFFYRQSNVSDKIRAFQIRHGVQRPLP